MFADLRRLSTLHLSHNVISAVEPRVFDESANLMSLTHIYLSYNRLTQLEPWPLRRAQRTSGYVDLSNNRIANFTNAMRWSFDCSSARLLTTKLDLTGNDVRHITDIVHGWNVDGRPNIK